MSDFQMDLTPEVEWAKKGGAWGAPADCGCNPAVGRCCFYHKLKTIQFNTNLKKSPQSQMEAQWDRDRPAYQRLRMNGLQPPSVKGSALLEKRASSQTEIEMGHLIEPSIIPKVEQSMAIARDIGWTPQESVEARKDHYNRD